MQASRKLWAFLRPYRRWVVLAPLLMLLEVSMDLTQPRLVERIVDVGIARSDLSVVLSTGALMIGAAILGMVGGMGCTVFAILAGQGFGADLRGTLFRRVQALSFGNLDKLETGKLITRLTNDVTQAQEVVMMALRMLVRAPLLLVGSVIMALLTSRQLAILYVVLMPLVLVMAVWVINRTFPLFGEVQRRLDAVNTVMQENLAGVRVVKAFARSIFENGRFRQANDRLTEQSLLAIRTGAITMPFMMLVLNFGIVGALWVGGQQITTGSMQIGQLIAFLNYLGQTLMSLMMVSMLVVRISRSEASAERIQQVLDAEPEVKRRPDAITSFAP
jgi:ATP-binding cassette, subfamily B, multidrug efflux pump